ncbi:MAG: PQQ-binding-like beta-propeller repeat protein [Bacteroidetes bacterium]|nr:PQQ-binding-like beta-propeller repeat protein [Bacteroidota bacterium]
MLSLSKLDGSMIWKSDLYAPISEGILLSGKYIYIGSLDSFLYAVSAETGNILWSEKLAGRIRTSPLEYKGSIYIGTENKYLYAFTMDPGFDE